MKFWLAAKTKDGQTREEFDFEWGYIHVALMLTTPSVMSAFQRYTQHRVAEGVTDDLILYGRHPEDWYNIADHWLEDVDSLISIFQGEDYPRRMHPHSFGSSSFTIELTEGEVLYDQDEPFTGRGGVKLVNFIARDTSIDQSEFATRWRKAYGPAVVDLATRGDLKRVVQNPQLPLDASLFAGTLFEAGGVQTYAGIEELWFEDLESLSSFLEDLRADDTVAAAADGLIDAERSFSMVTVERVVWDFTADPPILRPAIEDPNSMEAAVLSQEKPWGKWNSIDPVRSNIADVRS